MAGTVPPAGRILTLSSMSYCFRNRCAAASVAEPAVVTPMDCPASSGTEVYFLFANSEKIGRSEQVAIMTRSAPRRVAAASRVAGTAAALVAAGLAAVVAAAGAAVAWGGMLAVGVAAPPVVAAAVGFAAAAVVGALVAAGALVAGGCVGGADDVEVQPVA